MTEPPTKYYFKGTNPNLSGTMFATCFLVFVPIFMDSAPVMLVALVVSPTIGFALGYFLTDTKRGFEIDGSKLYELKYDRRKVKYSLADIVNVRYQRYGNVAFVEFASGKKLIVAKNLINREEFLNQLLSFISKESAQTPAEFVEYHRAEKKSTKNYF